MKSVKEKELRFTANAWGLCEHVYYETFEVEAEDVGKTRSHYLGYCHKDYTFTTKDVGRNISVITYPSTIHTSWSFC